MATNIIYDKIMKGVQYVLRSAASGTAVTLPVFLSDEDPGGGERLIISPELHTQLVGASGLAGYRYTVHLDYYNPSSISDKERTQKVHDIQYLLDTNITARDANDAVYYHQGTVVSVEYPEHDDEEIDYEARLVYEATYPQTLS